MEYIAHECIVCFITASSLKSAHSFTTLTCIPSKPVYSEQ
jgi:hypothetical protein